MPMLFGKATPVGLPVAAENVASVRVAEKNGMSLRGEIEIQGRVFGRYEITREEWERSR